MGDAGPPLQVGPVLSPPSTSVQDVSTASTDSAPGRRPARSSDGPRPAWGLGLATRAATSSAGGVLDVWYPTPALGSGPARASGHDALRASLERLAGLDELRGVIRDVVVTKVPDLGAPPRDTADVWLRLHLLSHRLVPPHGANLDGVFGLLTNVVWTSHGPCPVEGFELTRARLMAAGRTVAVHGVDKFPRMTDYVVPTGVRIADADRVRLGAHLAPGTTVMHEGFVNFNAGTLGTSMVEGRISAGVVVDDGSDIGGGASVMGTLSGGGTEVVSIGRRCLVGANAGIGISLGDGCVVEAGCYVTAGTKVLLHAGPQDGSTGPRVVKAVELSGADGVLFRRNSQSGAVEALPRTGEGIALNAALHAND